MMFVMEHYYDRVPLFVFPEIYTKNSGISPRELFYTYLEIKQLGKQVEYFSVSQLLASLYNRKRSKNIACALYKINETNKNRTLELDQT